MPAAHSKLPFTSKLDEIMRLHGISNDKLRERSGLSRSMMGDLRRGDYGNRYLSTLVRVSMALGLSVVDVFPVCGKSPKNGGLVQESERARERSRRKQRATG